MECNMDMELLGNDLILAQSNDLSFPIGDEFSEMGVLQKPQSDAREKKRWKSSNAAFVGGGQ